MILERNRVYNMDVIDGIKLIPDNSVKIIIADPPYFLGMTHNGSKGSFVDLAIMKPFFQIIFEQSKRILNKDGEFYMFCDWRSYAFHYPIMDAILPVTNKITWDKLSGAGNKYSFASEEILFHAANPMFNRGGSNVWRIAGFAAGAKKQDGNKIHPTQKTQSIIQKIFDEVKPKPNDLIIDLFAGSGTVNITAKENGFDCIGFELDTKNFGLIDKRLKQQNTKINFIQI